MKYVLMCLVIIFCWIFSEFFDWENFQNTDFVLTTFSFGYFVIDKAVIWFGHGILDLLLIRFPLPRVIVLKFESIGTSVFGTNWHH